MPSTIDKTPFRPFTSLGFQTALREFGATEDKLAAVINDAMGAKAGNWFKGEHTESEHADHAIRLRAADQLAELVGAKVTKVEIKSVNVSLNSDDLAAMLGI